MVFIPTLMGTVACHDPMQIIKQHRNSHCTGVAPALPPLVHETFPLGKPPSGLEAEPRTVIVAAVVEVPLGGALMEM
jgi:hypothetical protein